MVRSTTELLHFGYIFTLFPKPFKKSLPVILYHKISYDSVFTVFRMFSLHLQIKTGRNHVAHSPAPPLVNLIA